MSDAPIYVLRDVPDPDGQLADLLEELIDNGALVPLVSADLVFKGEWTASAEAAPYRKRENLVTHDPVVESNQPNDASSNEDA